MSRMRRGLVAAAAAAMLTLPALPPARALASTKAASTKAASTKAASTKAASTKAADTQAAGTFASNTLLFDSDDTAAGNYEIFAGTTSGGPMKQLTNDPTYDSMWPRISPDNQMVLFERTPKGDHDTTLTSASVWTMHIDGSGLTQIISPNEYGWTYLWHPEWSPDGTHLVMLAGATQATSNITITDSAGNDPRDLLPPSGTPGAGTSWDPSWSVDGQWIVFVGCYGLVDGDGLCPLAFGSQVYKVHPDGTNLTRLSDDPYPDFDPYMSPDGTKVAFIEAKTGTDSAVEYSLALVGGDGGDLGYVIDDGGANSRAGWASDSATIYFHRRPLTSTGTSFGVWRISDDGAGLTQLYPAPATSALGSLLDSSSYSFEYPAVVWPT